MKRHFLLLAFLIGSVLTGIAQTAADSLALVNADWQVTTLEKGMICKTATFTSLYGVPQQVSILEVSPKHFKFDVQVHGGMRRTSEVAGEANAVAALNGSFYNMKVGNSTCYLQQEGALVDTTTAGITQSNGALYINKGKLKLMAWDKAQEQQFRRKPGKATILAAGPIMMIDGKACSLEGLNRSFVETKHPRSGVVLTKDKRVLLIVVDGRRKGQCEGVSIAEFTHLARVLGGRDALNLDGGGSSTLWHKIYPKADGVINTPSDKSGERKVSNSLIVRSK